jgi:hypothetical protein
MRQNLNRLLSTIYWNISFWNVIDIENNDIKNKNYTTTSIQARLFEVRNLMIHLKNLSSLKKNSKILLSLLISESRFRSDRVMDTDGSRPRKLEATTNIKFYLPKNLCQKQKVMP